jgi:hypothetical protein
LGSAHGYLWPRPQLRTDPSRRPGLRDLRVGWSAERLQLSFFDTRGENVDTFALQWKAVEVA